MTEIGHVTTRIIPRKLGGPMPRMSMAEFDDLVDPAYLKPQYQPIFDLSSGEQIAAEALARWPELKITPDAAFYWAAQLDRLAELDEACRGAAIGGAVDQRPSPRFQLFVNLEPSVLGPDTADRILAQAAGKIGLVVEITERALTVRPADLLHAVQQLRRAGCAIALDDVGSVPDSLALLPFIAPDVIKLDVSLIQQFPDVDRAAIYTTVAAYAERTGATILAEGIETETHLRRALALGATLGQGWYLGWPGPLGAIRPSSEILSVHQPMSLTALSPFDVIDTSSARVGTKEILHGSSQHLEHQGLCLETPPVVLSAMQDARYFTPETARRYSHLGARCPIVAVFGADFGPTPASGVRGVGLGTDDPLRDEWVVAIVGAHYAGAFVARDLGDSGPERDRRFAFVLTHDLETVLTVARSLLGRVTCPSDFPG